MVTKKAIRSEHFLCLSIYVCSSLLYTKNIYRQKSAASGDKGKGSGEVRIHQQLDQPLLTMSSPLRKGLVFIVSYIIPVI